MSTYYSLGTIFIVPTDFDPEAHFKKFQEQVGMEEFELYQVTSEPNAWSLRTSGYCGSMTIEALDTTVMALPVVKAARVDYEYDGERGTDYFGPGAIEREITDLQAERARINIRINKLWELNQ